MRALTLIFVAAVVATGCTFERQITYGQPAAGTYEARTFQVKIGDAVSTIQGAAITNEFFKSANVPALLGRLFVDPDYASGAVGVAVLSGDLWDKQFGSDPSIIGRAIEIDGRPATVVGVASRGFQAPNEARLWIPRAQ